MIEQKRFIFVSPLSYEKWNWNNRDIGGIGGSETCHIEMAWRLAKRGHQVINYVDLLSTNDSPSKQRWRRTIWHDITEIDFSLPGIWIIFRAPDLVDKIEDFSSKECWLIMQDVDYPGMTEERLDKFNFLITLCPTHAQYIESKYPKQKDKIIISSNGLRMDLIRYLNILKADDTRDPNRLVWTSSPDRGLLTMIKIFKRAKEINPELTLHIYYGFNNIEKLAERYPYLKQVVQEIFEEANSPGIYFEGRVPQDKLYHELSIAGIWCYPTEFTETSCISCMEAQAMGAIPITNPIWALANNLRGGIIIRGNAYTDQLVQARYVGEIIRLSKNIELQQRIRKKMIPAAQACFNWERVVDQWEAIIYGYLQHNYVCQFNFQLKFAERGKKILNVGCDIDSPNLKALGAINVDVRKINPLKIITQYDIIADVRELSTKITEKFDIVILGDILEHIVSREEIAKALEESKNILQEDGYIVITYPEDARTLKEQRGVPWHEEEYVKGVKTYHSNPIDFSEMESIIHSVGMKIIHYEQIDYTFALGWGIVCQPIGWANFNR